MTTPAEKANYVPDDPQGSAARPFPFIVPPRLTLNRTA